MKKPELLAPCGSFEALRAAVFAGADAVYFGGKAFNARMNAKNFGDDALKEAVSFCHDRGVKVYITLNTLVLDREFKAALEYADLLYRAGADALITADLGLSAALRRAFPDLELHASTQACGSGIDSARVFASLGFCRMVAPREFSLSDLQKLTEKSPIEIETFIHGAICVCFSGQCLFSSVIGGRSGNRGECAQPCRMSYNGKYPLSLKDMCLAEHMTEILGSRVASLKIEGRMKGPDYVYAVTSVYRRLIDEERNATKKELELLRGIFSRSGFTDGYFTGKISQDMLGVRRDEDKDESRRTRFPIRERERRNPPIRHKRPQNAEKPETDLAAIRKKAGERPYFFKRTARFLSASGIPDTDFFDEIYLPLDRFEDGKANGIVMPPFSFDREEKKIHALLEKAVEKGAKHALVTHVGQIPLLKDFPLVLHGDYRLNLFNTASFAETESLGNFEDLMVSPEATLPQIRDLPSPKTAIVYGRLPLMTLYKPCGVEKLTDRTGAVFPVVKEFGRDVVLNSVPFYTAEMQTDLKRSGLNGFHFLFTLESAKEAEEIVRAYREKRPNGAPCKKIKKS